MADSHWMEQAFAKHKGALHRELGVPEGETIPPKTLAKAATKGGKEGQRARAAENAKPARKRRGVFHRKQG